MLWGRGLVRGVGVGCEYWGRLKSVKRLVFWGVGCCGGCKLCLVVDVGGGFFD